MKWSQAKIEEIESPLTWWTIEKVSDTNYWTSKSLEWNLKMVEIPHPESLFPLFNGSLLGSHVQNADPKNSFRWTTSPEKLRPGRLGMRPKVGVQESYGSLDEVGFFIWFIWWWRNWEEMDSRLKGFNFSGWFTYIGSMLENSTKYCKFNKKVVILSQQVFCWQFLYNQWIQLISFQKRHDTRDGFREAIKPIRVKNFGQWPDL